MITELNLKRVIGVRLLGLAFLGTALLGSAQSQAAPAKAESDGAFAARVCKIYVSPVGYPPATGHTSFGAGSGCKWKVGDGDIGTTAIGIEMTAERNASKESIARMTQGFEDLADKMAIVPGSLVKEWQINCGTIGVSGRVMFWGVPNKSNIFGYAVCGNHILTGSINTPPDSEMDTELVFGQLMNRMAALLN